MEMLEVTEKSFKDVNTDFVQMLGEAFGSVENPNFDKTKQVFEVLTELGNKNPVFLRKILSPQMMQKIAEVAPQLKGKSKMEFGMMAIPLISEFTELYKNA